LMIGGSGLVAPTLLLLRTFFGSKTLVFLHGLDLVVDSFVYQALFIRCIRSMGHVVANSCNTMQIAVEKGIFENRITVINPGTALPNLTNMEAREDFLQRKGISFKKIMVFVGRMTKRKGLSRFIEQSLPAIISAVPDTGLIVVGENPNQGLTNSGEGQEVAELVSRLEASDHVIFLGQVDDKDLEASYAAADVQIFPLIDIPGDVEGFGMVAIEAAACGTPTVAFSTGGVADAISPKNGYLVEPGRYDLLADAIVQTLGSGLPHKQQCIEHARGFDWNLYHGKVKSLVNSLYS
ncbi:unnamed protein product, partial [marine sediment metagenome]